MLLPLCFCNLFWGVKVTTEITDSLFDKFNTQAYKKQRRERLADSVFEYLSDDFSNPHELLDDLQSLLDEEVTWANKELTRRLTALKALSLIHI